MRRWWPRRRRSTTPASPVDLGDVPPDVATRLVRAMDRSPSTIVTLLDADLSIRWSGTSSTWVTGDGGEARVGANALERVHPDDAERIVHGLEQLRAATAQDAAVAAMPEPIRYRYRRADGRWIVVEATIHNLVDDPVVHGFVVFSRPVTGELDGAGYVIDLLGSDRPIPEVLAACAALVPDYVGAAATMAFLDGGDVLGVPDRSPVATFAGDPRWWSSARQGDTAFLQDFEGAEPRLAARARAAGFRSVWTVPIWDPVDGMVIGSLAVWVRFTIEPTIGVAEPIRHSRRLAGLVITEERRRDTLARLAATDPLTGIGNRSALDRRLDRATGPVTLALLDLDDFKPINDTHGHDTGDEVLRIVAARLRAGLRAGDLAVRFGGDEFAVVFSDGTDEDDARQSLLRVNRAIAAPIASRLGALLNVSASFGLAVGRAPDVVRAADAALYGAKRDRRRADRDDVGA